MKNTFPKFSPRIIVAGVAISLGLAASAFAMSPRGGELCGGPGAGMHGQRMAHGMKEMSRLHDELKLDARQEALWKEAEQAGAFVEDALSEHDAVESDIDLVDATAPAATTEAKG